MPVSRLTNTLSKCAKEGKTAFVAFLTAGFPSRADTVPCLLALQV